MDINEFLKEDNHNYDFTNDCIKNNEYMSLKGYDKYFEYKTINNQKKDPDSNSTLLQNIYKTLWPELDSKGYMNNKNKNSSMICSDTMTSVQYTLACYYEDMFPDEVKDYKKQNPRQRNISAKMCKDMFSKYETVKENLKDNKELEHFISVYHTLGNYCPVPDGFNKARSGTGCVSNYDYWDLTLMKIKSYFCLRQKQEISEAKGEIISLLHNHCEKKENVFSWLDEYKNWDEFVEKNFFQDYVDKNLEVIPLCKGHSWENGCNKISKPDYNEFFKNIWTRIEARTYRMLNALKEKI